MSLTPRTRHWAALLLRQSLRQPQQTQWTPVNQNTDAQITIDYDYQKEQWMRMIGLRLRTEI
jgi:hypothetical protein